MTPARPTRIAITGPLAAAAIAIAATIGAAPPARAQPVAATYTVHAAGLTIMELNAVVDITDATYAVEFRTRLRGVATAFGGGELVTRVEGVWQGDAARPRRYASEGSLRGESRRTVLEWPNNQPVIRVMVPPNEAERLPVPDAEQRNTIDNLSALAQLIRQVRRTGRCDGAVRVYDGRRLSSMTASTQGREAFPPSREEWSGNALKCGFEGMFLAGYRRDEDQEVARRPQYGTAWLAESSPGQAVIPVRVEAASRWFGTLSARLASAGPPGRLRPVVN